MEIISILFGTNAVFAFFGWLAWNGIMFSFHKDDDEKNFNIKSYALETYDNWLASFLFIPVMLFFGHGTLGIDIDGFANLKWQDSFYPLSGFAVEALKVIWKKWKAKNI